MIRKRKKEVVVPIFKDSYLAAIKNSVNAHLYRNFYAKVNNKREDVARNGELSCAYFVSSILVMFGLISKIHLTVGGVEDDLKKNKWKRIKRPQIGAILIWEAKKYDEGGVHRHMGFFMGKSKAISNSSEKGYPVVHHYTYGRTRKVTSIYWNKKLD